MELLGKCLRILRLSYLSFIVCDLSIVLKIRFVADDEHVNVWIGVLPNLRDPAFKGHKARSLNHTVHKHYPFRPYIRAHIEHHLCNKH